MDAYATSPDVYVTDRLPAGQSLIRTRNVDRFDAFMVTLDTLPKGRGRIGGVVGDPGLGKTIAAVAYVERRAPLPHTGMPPVVMMRLTSHATPLVVAQDLLLALRERPVRGNHWTLTRIAMEVMDGNDIKMLIVDEADLLTPDSFALLRTIRDKVGCSIVLVGSQELEAIFYLHRKFVRRMDEPIHFETLTEHEVLEIILPQLAFPHWDYKPDRRADLALGRFIWEHLGGSSLGTIYDLIERANWYVADQGDPGPIQRVTIERALTHIPKGLLRQSGPTPLTPITGSYETESDKRNDHKRKK